MDTSSSSVFYPSEDTQQLEIAHSSAFRQAVIDLFASITTAIESHGSLLEKVERTIDDMTPVIMERRAQVKSLQQQVTELRSSQGKRGKTPVAKEKTSHPRSRFHNPDTCSRRKTTITSFIRHSRPAWNSLRLKGSMRSDYMSVPTIACTTHFWSIRWKDAPPSRIDCRDTGSWDADRFQMKS